MSPDRDFGPVERALVLRKLGEFEQLSASQLALIGDQLRERHHRRGALLFSPGLPLSALAFVMDGSVAVSQAPAPLRLGPRQVLGDVPSLLSNAPAPHAVAERSSLTLELRRTALEDVFDDEFPVFVAVLRSLASTLLRGGMIALTPARRASQAFGDPNRPLDLVERVVLLRRTMDFAETAIGPLADLAEQASELSLPPGATLWQLGEPSDHFVIVVSGAVEARTESASLMFGPGCLLGAIEALALARRTHTAVARGPLCALRIPFSETLDLLEDRMGAGMSLLTVLARAVKRQS